MKVDGVGSNPAIAATMNRNAHSVKDGKPAEAEPIQTSETPVSEDKTKGVIRLLQEGHFKGVADVRLRINFHDELQALENQNLKSTAASGFEGLNLTVQEQIDALKESGLLDDTQLTALDGFLAELEAGQSEVLATDGDLQGLIDNWKAKLSDLIALLDPPAPAAEPQTELLLQEEVIQPEEPVNEPPAEGIEPQEAPGESGQQTPAEEITPEPTGLLPTEPLPEEPSPLQLLVQGFQENIQQALDQLQSDLAGSSTLPPISEPSGNGKAFAKFMAIYESMQAGPVPDLPEPELLDAEEVIIPDEAGILS